MQLFESKYDFTTTLRKALDEIDPEWERYQGLIIPGSHSPDKVEDKIQAIKNAREMVIPTLAICFGYQLVAIEWARNKGGIPDATSEEFSRGEGTPVVKRRMKTVVGEKDGESWWSNYEVVIDFKTMPWFFVAPFHPEYGSSKEHPHPLLKDFLSYVRAS